jgi:hypothetical protein
MADMPILPAVAPLPPSDGFPHPVQALTARAVQSRDRKLLAHFYHFVGTTGQRRWALCLSGGGIRSATFALGVLQGLARDGLLPKFHFLSTVSGGGYIGSWLQAWIHRHRDGIDGVVTDLREARGAPTDPDPPAVRRLREYSNYLAPRLGALSADTWTLAGIYLRNLLINWAVFIPLLAGVLAIPRLALSIMATDPPSWVVVSAFWLGVLGLIVALAVTGVSLPTGGPRKPHPLLARTQGEFLVKCLLPLSLGGLMLATFWAWVTRSPQLAAGSFATVQNWPGLLFLVRAVESVEWMRPNAPFSFEDYWLWIYAGALMHLIAWLTCIITLAVRRELYAGKTWRERGLLLLRDATLVVTAGAVGGGLVYIVATQLGLPLLTGSGNVAAFPFYVVVGAPLFWLLFLLAGTFYVAVRSHSSNDQEREWYGRSGAWLLIVTVSWLVATSLIIFGPTVLLTLWDWSAPGVMSLTTVTGLFTILGGGSARSTAGGRQDEPDGWREFLVNRGLALAAPLFLVMLIILLSWGTSALLTFAWSRIASLQNIWTYDFGMLQTYAMQADVRLGGWQFGDRGAHLAVLMCTRPLVASTIVVLFLGLCAIASVAADLNVFSLHGMYRDRLIRAYLAASRMARMPNPLTGFDERDNMPMHQLRPGMFTLQDACRLVVTLKSLGQDEVSKCVKANVTDTLPLGMQERIDAIVHPTEVDWDLGEVIVRAFNDLLATLALCKAGAPAADAPLIDLPAWNRAVLAARFPDLALQTVDGAPRRPLFPLINTALNLVAGDDLAWQERKAEAFVFSPLHIGGARVGYRRIQWREQDADRRYGGGGANLGVSLGTAITVSGAAANPNMGYHSSPVITFLLTLFNARLGRWMGNPRVETAAARQSPRFGVLPTIAEAIGFTNERRDYVNLSDGGHFENLGLYEAVRRRCHLVFVVDAGQDADFTFEDLGNAVSKIRVDFGVPIEFVRPPAIHRRDDPTAKSPSKHGALARIRYSCIDPGARDGWLLYVKPAIDGDEPADVAHYAKQHPDFPHQSTADQFFTETQFESYRALGRYTMQRILGVRPVRTEAGLVCRFYRTCVTR